MKIEKRIMKKRLTLLMYVFLQTQLLLFSQTDPLVLSYQRNFLRANISTKIDILSDAVKNSEKTMLPLFRTALDFTESAYSILLDDRQFLEMAVLTVTKLGELQDAESLDSIQRLLLLADYGALGIACITALSSAKKSNPEFTAFLISWYEKKLTESLTGKKIDPKLLEAAAATLGNLKDKKTFKPLFETVCSPIDPSIITAAKKAVSDNLSLFFTDILAEMEDKNLQKVYNAFSLVKGTPSTDAKKIGKIAEKALATGLKQKNIAPALSKKLINESLTVLQDLRWSGASPAVVHYFYTAQAEYKAGALSVSELIPVIRCMGAMGTTESVQALSIFLGMLNSETEKTKTYDENLILTLIQALGELGNKDSFDYLLYVSYLNYPDSIKKAAREAIAQLKW
ncbi:hypothetical protein HMPREF9554_00022 [Treponema phagedenis F0421]|nr:hypothetical protein HMPREF9554_00022 [Treponema phagedenis F0421]